MARAQRHDALEDMLDQGISGRGIVVDKRVTSRRDRQAWIEVADRHDLLVR